MKTYRVTTQEVVNGELGEIVDIIEFEADPLGAGKTVFHLLRSVEADILARSEEAS